MMKVDGALNDFFLKVAAAAATVNFRAFFKLQLNALRALRSTRQDGAKNYLASALKTTGTILHILRVS